MYLRSLYHVPTLNADIAIIFISKNVSLDNLPGFDRLSGLMTLMMVTFIIILVIYKTKILIGFFSSIQSFVIFGFCLFIVLKFSAKKLFR